MSKVKKPRIASAEGWGRWTKDTKKNHPIWYFFHETIPTKWGRACRRVRDVKWWFYHRFYPGHRYHMVNTRLKPGYYDMDYRMLHACFSLLCDYMENNYGYEDPKHWSKEERMLYIWWTKHRPNFRKEPDSPSESTGEPWSLTRNPSPAWKAWFDEMNRLEENWHKEDQYMLMRLIRIRRILWT